MKFLPYLLLSLTFLVVSCAGESSSETNNTADTPKTKTTSTPTLANAATATMPVLPKTKEGLVQAIEQTETELYGTKKKKVTFNPVKAQGLIHLYEAYTSQNKTAAETPSYLFKTAEVYRSIKDFDKAVVTYQKIYTDYPDYEKSPHSLFLLGFSYENDKKDKVKAKEFYQQFLEKYPKHELADDVAFSLKNLDKTPEEIIKEFEANMKKNK